MRSIAAAGALSRLLIATATVVLASLFPTFPAHSQSVQDSTLFAQEVQTIYLTNQQRRAAGLRPLRWNRELTVSARQFAQDAVENQPPGFCGHIDSAQHNPGDRMRAAGYIHPSIMAENAVCGYASPEDVLALWMASPPHRANLLNPALREVGVGYYCRGAHCYIVQDLSTDRNFGPVLINDEALTTTVTNVTLYLHDQYDEPGIGGVGHTTEVMLANTPDFAGGVWIPYAAELPWVLEVGEGWRTVYVRMRDRVGRTTTLQDTIYLGAALPQAELTLDQASAVDEGFQLDSFAAGGYTRYSVGLNWIGDDGDPDFRAPDGSGNHVADGNAVGGTAYQMAGSPTPSWAALSSAKVYRNVPLVAFFRLKTDDATSADEQIRLKLDNGEETLAEIDLRGTDFSAAGLYQEFAVPFTYPADSQYPLYLQVHRLGSASLWWDEVSLYTAPAPITSPLSWQVPDRYLRSSQVWLRLWTPSDSVSAPVAVDRGTGSVIFGATNTSVAWLRLERTQVALHGATPLLLPPSFYVAVTCLFCGENGWLASGDQPWLAVEKRGNLLAIGANPVGLVDGLHTGTVAISLPDTPLRPPQNITVMLTLDPQLTQQTAYLPLVGSQ